MTRAAIYARYSSHHQREESIELQVERSEAWCAENGHEVVAVYADRATSGTSADRAEFNRMMEDAKAGRFDVVVVWKATRIMRNRDEMAIVRFRLKKCGVHIEYAGESLPEGASGDLMLAMLEAMAEYESKLMGERIADGMRKSAEACKACGMRVFGYFVDEDDVFHVDEAEAEAVRMAYAMVAHGQPIAEAVRALAPYRTRRGNRFGFQAVRDMLTRPCYRGLYRFAGVEVEGGMPRIVDDETWGKVQEVLKVKKVRPRSSADYVLTGKLAHSCGVPMVGTSGTGRNGKHCYYRCKACKESYRKEAVEGAVRSVLLKALEDEGSRAHIADLFMEYQAETSDTSRLDALRADLADVRARIGRVWDAIESGAYGGNDRLQALKEREQDILAAMEDCDSQREFTRQDLLDFLDEFAGLADDAMAAPFVSSVVVDGDNVHCTFVFDAKKPPEPDGSDGPCSGSPELSLGELTAYAVPGGFVVVGPLNV